MQPVKEACTSESITAAMTEAGNTARAHRTVYTRPGLTPHHTGSLTPAAASRQISLRRIPRPLRRSSAGFFFFFFASLRMYATVFNFSAAWAATFRLRGVLGYAGYFRVSIIHRTLTWTATASCL